MSQPTFYHNRVLHKITYQRKVPIFPVLTIMPASPGHGGIVSSTCSVLRNGSEFELHLRNSLSWVLSSAAVTKS